MNINREVWVEGFRDKVIERAKDYHRLWREVPECDENYRARLDRERRISDSLCELLSAVASLEDAEHGKRP